MKGHVSCKQRRNTSTTAISCSHARTEYELHPLSWKLAVHARGRVKAQNIVTTKSNVSFHHPE